MPGEINIASHVRPRPWGFAIASYVTNVRPMVRRLHLGMLAMLSLLTGSASLAQPGVVITAPPASLNLDPFYTRYLDADGIPVTSSSKVPDEALIKARDIVVAMLSHRPDLTAALVARGQRVG